VTTFQSANSFTKDGSLISIHFH